MGVRGWGSAPCPRRVLCVPALAGLCGVLMGRGEPRLGGGHSAHLGGGCGVPPGTAEAVYLLASSADGNWLAAVSGDWEIHVYSLKHFKVGEGAGCTAPLSRRERSHEAGTVPVCPQLCPLPFQHHCTVPTYSCAVTALAIHPATNNLVIAYADQQVGAVPSRIPSPHSAQPGWG